MTPLIEIFTEKIKSLQINDYESFEQVATHALDKVQMECHRNGIYDLDEKINEIRQVIQNDSRFEVPSAKNLLLSEAEYLDQLITAHKQDWESYQNL